MTDHTHTKPTMPAKQSHEAYQYPVFARPEWDTPQWKAEWSKRLQSDYMAVVRSQRRQIWRRFFRRQPIAALGLLFVTMSIRSQVNAINSICGIEKC